MKKNNIIFTITFISLFACQEKTGKKFSGIEHAFVDGETLSEHRTVKFDRMKEFELSDLIKTNDYPSSDQDTAICKEWTLTKSAIEQIIKDSKPISGPEWHHLFGHFPCRIHGKLLQELNEFEVSINSGAWLTVSSTDTTLIFGSFKEENNKYFLSAAWSVEEMEEKE